MKVSSAAIALAKHDPIVRRIERDIVSFAGGDGLVTARWQGLIAARHYRIREIAYATKLPYPVSFAFGAWEIP